MSPRTQWLASAFLSILDFTASSPLVLHERRHEFAEVYQGERLDEIAVTKFRIGLKQNNLDNVYDHLLDISSSHSPNYGKLWTTDEVREAFAPSQESVDVVRQWLESSGIENVTARNGWLSFTSNVGHVEQLLDTKYHEYESSEDDEVRIGCDQYHLPEHISPHVDFVTPAVTLSGPVQRRTVKRDDSSWWKHHSHPWNPPLPPWGNWTPPPGNERLPKDLRRCGHVITPACIRALYDMPSPEEVASSYQSSAINSLGVFENFGTYNQDDLDIFFTRYASNVPNGTHPIGDSIDGARVIQSKPPHGHRPATNSETALDIMIMYGLIYPQTVTLYEVSDNISGVFTESYETFSLATEAFLDALDGSFCSAKGKTDGLDCGRYEPTRVISISYGTAEIMSSEAYLKRQCNEFGKLSLQGVTFTISSGDSGVGAQAGRRPDGKLTNGCIVAENYKASHGRNGPKQNGTVFSTSWPATCPYVLSVGATRLYPNQTVYNAESSMIDLSYSLDPIYFTTGGGFSNYFSRPSYQDKAVSTYFAEHDPGYPHYNFNGLTFKNPKSNIGANGGLYNRIGRGIPDVSANGLNFPIIFYGNKEREGGTSQASPIWASVFTLINEKRSEIGKSSVGFVNAVLYEHPEVFNDITNGTNPACGTDGFPAVTGWDPNTGLGTPNYPKLLELFLSLP